MKSTKNKKEITPRTDAPRRVSTNNFTNSVQTRQCLVSRIYGFTLVELIVVITILAILGTIGFLSFQGYSSSARDSVRISDLTNIQKGLSLYQIKSGYYPLPDDPVNITVSGAIILHQGYAGEPTLKNINLSNGGKDLLDLTYYTYTVNADKTKMQLLGFLENNPLTYNNIQIIDQAYADSYDYSTRYPIVKGDNLGIILNSGTLVPVQTNTGIELKTATGYIAYINNTTILQGTGSMMQLAFLYTSSKYPGCDTDDIELLNGQVWAACNVGANTSSGYNTVPVQYPNGTATIPANRLANVQGSYFQWGRNDDVTPVGTPTTTLAPAGTLANTVGHANFILRSSSFPYDWISTRNDNLWGGSGTTPTAGTYSSQGSPSAMQGPCATGYHVPTIFEWCQALKNINGSITCTNGGQNDTNIATTLKLPLAGSRDNSNAYYNFQGTFGRYWSSSPSGQQGYKLDFSSTQVNVSWDGRSLGLSVRCIQN